MTWMRSDLSGLALFAKSRTRPRTLSAVAVAVGCWVLLAGQIVPVPLIAGTPTVPLEPLLPTGLSIILGALCADPMPEIEEIAGPRLGWAKVVWIAVLLSAGTASVVALDAIVGSIGADQAIQGWLSFAGLTLVGVRVLGSALAWVGPVTLLTAMLFVGKDQFNEVREWAWLLRGAEAGLTGHIITASLLVLGVVCYLFRSRGRRQALQHIPGNTEGSA